MFHVHAWGYPYIATMLGLKQVYCGRYVADSVVALFQREKVTLFVAFFRRSALPAFSAKIKPHATEKTPRKKPGFRRSLKAKRRGLRQSCNPLLYKCQRLRSAVFEPVR